MQQFNTGTIFFGREFPQLPSIEAMGDFASPFCPKPSPGHVFPGWAMRALPQWWSRPARQAGGLFVCGPSGCGKSSTLREWCARTGTPMYAVTANGRLEFPDLVGHVSLESDGAGGTRTAFVYGPLSLAMKNGGLFLLDELDLLDPSVCAGLNGVLDGSPLVIPENGGEVIEPHPAFRFAATGNSAGGGDSSGMYAGVLQQNAALMDRFTVVSATWLSADAERSIVAAAVPDMPKDALDAMLKVAASVRDTQKAGASRMVAKPLTTRSLIRWAGYAVPYSKSFASPQLAVLLEGRSPLAAAFMDSWANGLGEGDAVTVREIWQLVMGFPMDGTPSSDRQRKRSMSSAGGGSNA